MLDWIKQHKWYVIAGIGGLALFVYLWLRSQSSDGSSSVVIPPAQPVSPPVGGGTQTGALNLSSGSPVNLPQNLTPPNCGPGMTPVPNVISQGEGQPSFLIGWNCVPTSNSNPPPTQPPPFLRSGGCPMPDCIAGTILQLIPGQKCPTCVPRPVSPFPSIPNIIPIGTSDNTRRMI